MSTTNNPDPKTMKILEIINELLRLNVSCDDCFDKEELCDQLIDARSRKVKESQPETNNSSTNQENEQQASLIEVNPAYLEYCRNKSFLLLKAVDLTRKDYGNAHMELIHRAKENIETKYSVKMGAGATKRFLKSKGFVNGKLGAGRLITNEELCLYHKAGNDRKWVPSVYQAYAKAVKFGVLIMAVTPEHFQSWAKSSAYLQETKDIPRGRLFVYIEHTKHDGGGVQGYIVAIDDQNDLGLATVLDGIGYLIFHNGNYYHGLLKGGLKDRHGTLSYANGDKYVGGWKRDKKHGHGTQTWEGGKYVGKWENNNMHGEGTYTYVNGNKYVGNYKNGKRNGHGTLTWGKGKWEGDKYVGKWRNNNMHGEGIYTYANGDKHVGGWKDNKQHGRGIYTYNNGRIERREYGFKNGKLVYKQC